jgi:small-conductance mechanosensitive channel
LEKQKFHAWIYVAGLLLFVLDGFVVYAGRIDPHDESNRAALLEVLVLMLPYWAGFLVAALKGTWRNSLAAFAASWMIVAVVVWFLMFAGRDSRQA